tara:strand:- start:89601 stop:90794 length:1194 start_codon:yes stop_codon:yes gene_type:complete
MSIQQKVKELAGKYRDYMIQTRRYLHQHPEVSYKEFETTKFIKSELDKLGIPYESPLETGCVGIFEGGITSDKVVALRADIDALAMTEEGEAKQEFLSKNAGAAHCCGHDAHTANLLGVAHILTELKEHVEGKVLLLFQPGEEKLPGGGRLMCESGFLNKQGVQSIYGLHTSPSHDPGTIASKKGSMMAAPDEIEIEIFGVGGHAARPHEAVDPIVLAAQFVSTAQSIISRSIDPTDSAVITIGRIEGGTAHNIIPESVKLWGTVRTFTKKNAELIERRLHAILKGITEAAGGTYKLDYNYGYPAVLNSVKETDAVFNNMISLFGSDSVIEMTAPVMAGEDFAFYQEHFPGAFFFVGSGSKASDSQYVWHHPKYNVDDRFFDVAAPLVASLVVNDSQ